MTVFNFCNLLILSPICQEPGSPEPKQKDRIWDLQFNQASILNIEESRWVEWRKTYRVHISASAKKSWFRPILLAHRCIVSPCDGCKHHSALSYSHILYSVRYAVRLCLVFAAARHSDKCQDQIKVKVEDSPIPPHPLHLPLPPSRLLILDDNEFHTSPQRTRRR